MSQEDLRVVVNDLSARLVQAEDHIKQLLQLTALLQSELSEQRNVIKSHFIVCNGSQHVYERANIQSASQQTYGALAAGSNVTAQPGQPLDESWVFNDNMDIDWDALDVLNIETSPEITPTNPIDAPQLPTFVAPVGNGQQYPIRYYLLYQYMIIPT